MEHHFGMVSNKRKQQALRFAVTGVISTAVHVSVAAGLINAIAVTPPLANGVAFAVATVVSYLVNTRWSFSTALSRRTLIRFVLVSGLGSLLAMAASWLAETLHFHYLIGIAGVVCTVPPVTFLLHSFWTYQEIERQAASLSTAKE